nr:TPA_asm: ATP8 [Echinogammarus berilloni]
MAPVLWLPLFITILSLLSWLSTVVYFNPTAIEMTPATALPSYYTINWPW